MTKKLIKKLEDIFIIKKQILKEIRQKSIHHKMNKILQKSTVFHFL